MKINKILRDKSIKTLNLPKKIMIFLWLSLLSKCNLTLEKSNNGEFPNQAWLPRPVNRLKKNTWRLFWLGLSRKMKNKKKKNKVRVKIMNKMMKKKKIMNKMMKNKKKITKINLKTIQFMWFIPLFLVLLKTVTNMKPIWAIINFSMMTIIMSIYIRLMIKKIKMLLNKLSWMMEISKMKISMKMISMTKIGWKNLKKKNKTNYQKKKIKMMKMIIIKFMIVEQKINKTRVKMKILISMQNMMMKNKILSKIYLQNLREIIIKEKN